jgi:NADPH-dependent 2,4-dienoyl-CoA reductase/sulfur reductase-like enzyme
VIESDLAIVGAGPAGLAAAERALEHGLTVTLLDDNPMPGGQYFRQPPAALRRGAHTRHDAEHRRAEALFKAIAHPRLRYLSDAIVWDAPEPGVLAFARGRDSGRVRAAATILAAGAVERAVPFPGWTLPGVMTAGGVQNLIKSQRMLPGRRFLVAGNGPLLLVVADSILRAGGTVVEVVESASSSGAWRFLPRLMTAPDLLRRGLGYRARLLRARVPLRSGATIVEARGDDEVREAVVAPIDAAGRVDRSRARSVSVDTVVAGFGLVPSVELTRLLGCRVRWDAGRGGFVPERSADLETTVPGVFAVGDGAGIGGAEVALAEGELAGLLAAGLVGRGIERDVATELGRLRARLARLHRVRDAIAALWTPPASFLALLTPDTIVCRCEEVTVGDLASVIDDGDPGVEPVKTTTRVTMGRCQGRNCLATVAELVARARGVSPAEVERPRARPPARPIVLGDLLHEPLPPPRAPD